MARLAIFPIGYALGGVLGADGAVVFPLDARIPRDLETICQKALAKRPEGRDSTVRAFLEDIRRYETGEPLKMKYL